MYRECNYACTGNVKFRVNRTPPLPLSHGCVWAFFVVWPRMCYFVINSNIIKVEVSNILDMNGTLHFPGSLLQPCSVTPTPYWNCNHDEWFHDLLSHLINWTKQPITLFPSVEPFMLKLFSLQGICCREGQENRNDKEDCSGVYITARKKDF